MSIYPLVFGLVSNLVAKALYIEAFLDFPQVFGQMLFSSSNCAKTDYFHILFNLLFAYHPIFRRFILRTIHSVIK
jgi:hypothetical protein